MRIQYKGALYHVMARGNNREKTFFVPDDYTKFRSYLLKAQDKYGCLIHAYILMPNHYHLLIETPLANLSRIMHFVNSSYTAYINYRHERYGHLFQGRYKSILVEKDAYLLQVSRYIHLNPVVAGIVSNPDEYPYTSYRNYLGQKDTLVHVESALRMMDDHLDKARAKYKNFVETKREDDEGLLEGSILGSPDFIEAKRTYLNSAKGSNDRNQLGTSGKSRVSPDFILQTVCNHFETNKEQPLAELHQEPRKVAIYLLKLLTPATNEEIGQIMGGISNAAVSKICYRFSQRMKHDPGLKTRVEMIAGSFTAGQKRERPV